MGYEVVNDLTRLREERDAALAEVAELREKAEALVAILGTLIPAESTVYAAEEIGRDIMLSHEEHVRKAMAERDEWRERCAFLSSGLAAYGDRAARDPELIAPWVDKLMAERDRRKQEEAWHEGWTERDDYGREPVNPYNDRGDNPYSDGGDDG